MAKKPVSTPSAPPTFAGFPRSAPAFFHELSIEMSRDWFTANKARYEAEWVAPMTALLGALATKLAPAYKPVKLAAPKVMRIHRDVRFSKDKAPYKTHIGALISVADRKLGPTGNAALYIHLGTDEEFVGVGTYMFEPERLVTWRKAVAGKSGTALAAIVAKLRKAGYVVGGHDDFKKVPRGFAPDHPRAEMLKWRGLTGSAPAIPRGMLHQAKLADWLLGHAKALAPLVRWLHQHVR